jgi:hypothetical protein
VDASCRKGVAQQFGLTGQRGIVEVQVDDVRSDRVLVDAQVRGKRDFLDERAPARLAAHQSQRPQFSVHAAGRDKGDALALRKFAVRRQARARHQATAAYLRGKPLDQLPVPGLRHR